MSDLDLIKSKWDSIKEFVMNEFDISNVSYKTFIEPLTLGTISNNSLILVLPNLNNEIIGYVTKRFTMFLEIAIEEIIGRHFDVVFSCDMPEDKPVITKNKDIHPDILKGTNLNPNYTFDTFVVGKNNSLAHAASLAVAESPAIRYNPLFIYGGVGLGKTHLMHSIANFIIKNNHDAKIIYITSEQFTNELIEAIRNKNSNATSEFRNKYRTIDILLIDDIQFIANKESTQEEFFHTFNALYEAKKQIVISSDRPPKELTTLEERLRSRFEMGLTVDISSPDYETRMAILRKKEEMDGYNIDNEIIKYIANNVKSNIRELEGSLNKIIAFSKLYNIEITMDVAEQALKDLISPDAVREITPELIIQVVADHYDLNVTDLLSTRRSRDVSYPRQIAMYLCRDMTPVPLNMIGQALGGRDHTTILHGYDRISEDLKDNPSLSSTLETLKKKINPK